MDGLKLRSVGRTDLQLSALGLGCWQFSNGRGLIGGYWSSIAERGVREIVETTLDGGINWFDTAEIYGRGGSERALAHALSTLDVASDNVVIATKWWPLGRRAASIAQTFPERVSCLSPYPITLHQIHQPFSLASIPSQMKEMARLHEQGLIRAVGVSNFSAAQMRAAHKALAGYGIPLASNQVKYSLLDRRIERNGVLDTAHDLGISIIAYSPLEQGILTGAFHRDAERLKVLRGARKLQVTAKRIETSRPLIDRLETFAKKYEATASQIALHALVTLHGELVFAIPGASNVRQAQENAGALHISLTEEERSEIQELSLRVVANG
ncbi:aldo/keto reductase [Ferroacidibacillus organovorans]|uniref:Aldo/keto reductase n=1 Tax=Ferroacidibacillus organovorans TaxID=1765683 RepID=A0A1V4EXD7_9BACL|nr:aldo/keto reductase [Ferroacidibacillus organovorans]OPG17589.1 aldo/keto reductase [Ferroacidibacillus organovorans]